MVSHAALRCGLARQLRIVFATRETILRMEKLGFWGFWEEIFKKSCVFPLVGFFLAAIPA